MAKALLMQMIYFISLNYERRQITARPSLAKISTVIAHIEANYTKEVYLTDLASMAHISLRKLHRYFQSATGLSPNEYLIRMRIMRGAELLRRDDLNITEAAFQTGFNDSNYFSRMFHAVMGITPSGFRKLQIDNATSSTVPANECATVQDSRP